MLTFVVVAQTLADAGFHSEADIEAAADVLEDALIVADAQDAQNTAQ